ncbi:DEAD/DEAH box helicase [Bradyrhizobium elkanii]|uniref:DEAD/DEAH box helicase n=1 Tax=Bradyrhizobium elkanii TaxID=29448 RepID=UPI003517C629
MNSPASGSGLEAAYHLLHPKIRRWIRDQGWDELREIQARTIFAVLEDDRDILISATTAAGKTEAAFLPILTSIAERNTSGFSVLYISPLKALINDQFRRLEGLCESMEIPVVKWHGDAPQAEKKKAMNKPNGIALITPESIEAMFVRRPADAKRLLSAAEFIVIDELHSFLQGPRGLHVASLLRRIDAMAARPARRVGLSATIGNLGQARAWLRPRDPTNVEELVAKSDAPELRLQVRGYVEPPDLDDPDHAEGGGPGPMQQVPRRIALDSISDHLFETLRGENNLVFGGSRRTVESTADRLRRRSEKAEVPNEFYPHHGSLSKVLREELEDRLKEGRLPTTAVCTSTLELGVDIGSVKSVAQIGAPRSLASLKQRLGRTGRRRGTPSILRIYLREPNIDNKSGFLDRLRLNTIRSVAVVRLLLEGFVEEARAAPEIASTLIHQMLSVIMERGGIGPKPLYDLLCGPGPFASISTAHFALLLRHLGSQAVRFIEQAGRRNADARAGRREGRPVPELLRGVRIERGVAVDHRRTHARNAADHASRPQGRTRRFRRPALDRAGPRRTDDDAGGRSTPRRRRAAFRARGRRAGPRQADRGDAQGLSRGRRPALSRRPSPGSPGGRARHVPRARPGKPIAGRGRARHAHLPLAGIPGDRRL